ncbi:hypothetical protein Megpolyxen_00421 [Candidatus Megaera polyxenophila]|nr:hypothetical protein Megpolyxen_00421 [Candidatus Megaera polyxenophila]
MAKTGNTERTTIPEKERTAKDHAKAVGNGRYHSHCRI